MVLRFQRVTPIVSPQLMTHIPHPLGWRATYFPRGILSGHSTTQQWYVVVT